MPYPTENDRRKFTRVTPSEPIRAWIAGTPVSLVDVSLGGIRVAHESELPPPGSTANVRIEFEGNHVDIEGELRHSKLHRESRGADGKPVYHSGLRILNVDPAGRAVLRRVVESYAMLNREEQAAHAVASHEPHHTASPTRPAESHPRHAASVEFVRCELLGGKWFRNRTREGHQPESGFTVAATESAERIETLCRTFEKGDDAARRLLRKVAALSVTNAEVAAAARRPTAS